MVEECIKEYLSSFVFGDLYRLPITKLSHFLLLPQSMCILVLFRGIPQGQIFICIESHFNENYCTSTFKVLSMVLNKGVTWDPYLVNSVTC